MRLMHVLCSDIRFQYLHGFYAAYGLISAVYMIILYIIPEEYRAIASTFILFSDPAMLGFFFVGGIFLLERDQGIQKAIFVTPVRLHEYLLSKCVSLSLLSILFSVLIATVVFPFSYHLLPLLLGIGLCACFFTLLGIKASLYVRNISQYLLLSPIIIIIFFLPVLSFIGVYESKLFWILPSHAALLLIDGMFNKLSLTGYTYCICNLLLWIAAAYFWVARSFYRSVVLTKPRVKGVMR